MIKARGLTKRYGDFTAVDNVDIDIEKDHIYGFLGLNGAGKTTTLGMITGTLSCTSGSIEVCGADMATDSVSAKKHIGFLPENPPLYPDLTPYEYLLFVAEAKGLKRKTAIEAANKALAMTGLTTVKDRLIKNLSKGYKQRTGIAQAIIGDPDIIIFDEPTSALDPKQVTEVRELIKKLSKGRTVILSSHILSEIEEICDRLIIISSGKIVAGGSLSELRSEYTQNDVIEITAKCKPQRAAGILDTLKKTDRYEMSEEKEGAVIRIETPKDKDIRESLFFAFAKAGVPITGMRKISPTLEDVFLKATSCAESGEESDGSDKPPCLQGPVKTPKAAEATSSEGGSDRNDDTPYRPLFG